MTILTSFLESKDNMDSQAQDDEEATVSVDEEFGENSPVQ